MDDDDKLNFYQLLDEMKKSMSVSKYKYLIQLLEFSFKEY